MNNDLISREALKDTIELIALTSDTYEEMVDRCEKAIDNAPTVDERLQGKWVHLHAIGDYKCSICGCENLYKYANEHERWIKTNSNYCPNCGADMSGEEE